LNFNCSGLRCLFSDICDVVSRFYHQNGSCIQQYKMATMFNMGDRSGSFKIDLIDRDTTRVNLHVSTLSLLSHFTVSKDILFKSRLSFMEKLRSSVLPG